jgi:hypothetical protein
MLGKALQGGSILVFSLTAMSLLCLGAVDGETLPYLAVVGLLALSVFGVGKIIDT